MKRFFWKDYIVNGGDKKLLRSYCIVFVFLIGGIKGRLRFYLLRLRDWVETGFV